MISSYILSYDFISNDRVGLITDPGKISAEISTQMEQ